MPIILWCVISSVLFSSCMSVIPHQVTLTAAPTVRQEKDVHGYPIQLSVIDARPQKAVGMRSGMLGASITVAEVIPYMERQVAQGLEAKGFVVTQEEAARHLTLSLTRFAWETRSQSGIAQIGVAIDLKAESRAPFSAPLTRFYVYDDHAFTLVTPMSDEVDQRFNAGMANILSQLFADAHLFTSLAKGQPS